MLKSLKNLAFALPLLAALPLHAQNITSSGGIEFLYGSPSVVRPQQTSCYSDSYANTPFGSADLYLSGWSLASLGASSEFIWQMTAPGDPNTILDRGSFLYQGVTDIEVAAAYNWVTSRTDIFVAYYKVGVGHFMDTYEITSSTTTPVVLLSSTPISNAPSYGRIRMDVFRSFHVVAAWEYPGAGIQTMVYNGGGTWSAISTLSGTLGESGPDVAFSDGSGTLKARYAYYNSASGDITESAIDMSTISSASGTVVPNVEDVNPVGASLRSNIVLDCPELYDAENWAYTYTDGSNVFVRYIDNHTMGAPTTTRVNDGSLGNNPTTPLFKAYSPTIYYGTSAVGSAYGWPDRGQIIVGWYATDGGSKNGYIALEMKEDGSGIINLADYMGLPNAFTPSPYLFTKGLAFSKNSMHAPEYLYATYYDFDNATTTYQLHHAFHKWGDVVFKGESAQAASGLGAATIANAYPNPFYEVLNTSVYLQESGAVQLQLTDMTGRMVWQHNETFAKGVHHIKAEGLKALASGSYMLTVSLNNQRIDTKKVIKQ